MIKQIQEIAFDDLQTKLEIQTFGMSKILSNVFSSITYNLKTIANTTSSVPKQDWNSHILLDNALVSTVEISDGYYIYKINENTSLFADTSMERPQNYNNIDLTQFPIQLTSGDQSLRISTTIDPNDNNTSILLYLPIINNSIYTDINIQTNNQRQESSSFNGLVFASIKPKILGNFIVDKIHPMISGNIMLIDIHGTVLYSFNNKLIGSNYFETEFQSYLSNLFRDKKDEFNNIIKMALVSDKGVYELVTEDAVNMVAYESVWVLDNSNNTKDEKIGTFLIFMPNRFANDVITLIESQKAINFLIIFIISSISISLSVLLLKGNKFLKNTVNQKTLELGKIVNKLRDSHDELIFTKRLLEKSNYQLRHSNKKLNEVVDSFQVNYNMQKEFINNAAHELRTPIQPILGATSMLTNSMIGQEDKNLVKTISRNAERLRILAENILDASLIEGRSLNLNIEDFKLIDVIIENIDIFKNDLDISHIRFEYSVNSDLIVSADKVRIERVLFNILIILSSHYPKKVELYQ